MIEILTFTGVDRFCSFDKIKEIADLHDRTEFGILIGSRTDDEDAPPIFPPLKFVRKFGAWSKENGVNSSLHMCGKFARHVLREGMNAATWNLLYGFNRVQVNIPKALRLSRSPAVYDFADKCPVKVITQHGGPWESVLNPHHNLEHLFDLSGGHGIDGSSQWPVPDINRRCGYAGGIGMPNFHKVLTFANRYPSHRLWFDMESMLRDGAYMDLRRVKWICERRDREGM